MMSQGICQDSKTETMSVTGVLRDRKYRQETQASAVRMSWIRDKSLPSSAYVPGSHRKGKCIKGNRRDIYNNGRCADEQKGAWDLHQFPVAAGRNTAFFMVRQDDAKRTIKATRTERLMMQKHKEDREKKTFSPAFVYRSLDV